MRPALVGCWILAATIQPLCLAVMVFSARTRDSVTPRAREVSARLQIRAFLTALDAYSRDTGTFPSTSEGLLALRSDLGKPGWNGPYLDRDIAPDPWGRPYTYRLSGITPEILSRDGHLSSGTLGAPIPKSYRGCLRLLVFAIAAAGFIGYPFLPRIMRKLQ